MSAPHSPPLVTIAMPFYNGARTMATAIRSIRLQSYPHWELLLCDDAGTDAGSQIARSFGDPRIVVWGDQRRLGLAARLNECIERAHGPYLARMDADDIAYPLRLDKQVRFLQDHPEVDLVGGWAVLFAGGGAPFGKRADPAAHADIARWPLHSFKLIHPTFMGKASWFRKYRYRADAIRREDHDPLFRAREEALRQPAGDSAGLPAGVINLRKRRGPAGRGAVLAAVTWTVGNACAWAPWNCSRLPRCPGRGGRRSPAPLR